MGKTLRETNCINCDHPFFAHDSDSGFGCSQELPYEEPAGGVMEYAPCGCTQPIIPSVWEEQLFVEYRDEINELVSVLGCTRYSAMEIVKRALKDGYEPANKD